jgi:hypothetical protein
MYTTLHYQSLFDDYSIGGLKLGEARFSTPIQTDLGAHQTSSAMFTKSFSEIKWHGESITTPHHLAPRFQNSVALPPSVPSWQVIG